MLFRLRARNSSDSYAAYSEYAIYRGRSSEFESDPRALLVTSGVSQIRLSKGVRRGRLGNTFEKT